MIENTKIHLIVDSKELTCPICFMPFGTEENLPVSVNCGHTFCLTCINKIKECAICKAQFHPRQKFNKSILISSLLLSYSQVKKCTFHDKPLEGFCLDTGKWVCFGCLADKQSVISIKDLEEKVCQLSKITKETQEKYKTQVDKFLKTEQEDFKKRIDNILSEEVCYALILKERLYKEIEGFKIALEKIFNKNALLEKIKNTERKLEKWRNNNHQEDDKIVKEIIETKLDFSIEIFEKTKADLRKEVVEKQNRLLREINNNQTLIKCLSKKLKRVLERPPYMLLDFIPVDVELQYLVEICQENNLLAKQNNYSEILVLKDCTIPNFQAKFNPIFFDCRLSILNIGCLYSLNLPSILTILGQIMENTSTLQYCTITIFKIRESEFAFFSNLLEKLKNLKEFTIKINGISKAKHLLGKLRTYLISQVCFLRFNIQLESNFYYEILRIKLRYY